MSVKNESENERAHRISLTINENHLLLAAVYENLVDRNFKLVERDAKILINDLKLIIKSIEDDDF